MIYISYTQYFVNNLVWKLFLIQQFIPKNITEIVDISN